jgi:cytochrome b561
MLKDSTARYGAVTKSFHWTLALLIIGMLILGWVMADLPEHSSLAKTLGSIHKSTGVLTLALGVLFILWRLVNPRPSLAELPAWQRYLAHTTHYLLYFILLAQPLAGLIMVMASGHPVDVYGLFTLPIWAPQSDSWKSAAHLFHTGILPWLIVMLLVLHVAGAIYHHFVREDSILRRMLAGAGSDDQTG